jgi:hypothetical protein
MMKKKIEGLFRCMPFEKITSTQICSYTNSTDEVIQPYLKELRDEGIIKGKKVLTLKKKPKGITP